jgi:Uma2 family endonuclease
MSAAESWHMSLVWPWRMLPLRVRMTEPLDDDELLELCAKNGNLRIERTSDGELIIMPPAGGETGLRNLDISMQLGLWTKRDGSGIGFDSSTGFILPNRAERSPDASWVRRDRWNALTKDQRAKFVPLCPDFVIELRSPSDRLSDTKEKMLEWIEQGAQLGWLIDPEDRSVYVYRPRMAPLCRKDLERIEGDPVLPGFVLELGEIW